MGLVRLNDIALGGDGSVDDEMRRWREAIERANAWDVSGAAEFDAGPAGHALRVKGHGRVLTAIVATGGITARVDADTDGQGNAVIWNRAPGSPNRQVGLTVKVYNSFDAAPPAGTFIKILPGESGDYELIASDCF